MYGHNYEYLHYGYNNNTMNNKNVDDHFELSNVTIPTIIFPSSSSPSPSPIAIPYPNNVINYDHDSISALKTEMCYSSTSGCSSYGSPTSHTNTNYCYNNNNNNSSNNALLQRSISTLSLQKNNVEGFSHPLVSSPSAYAAESSETSSVRKVFSAGDLQEMNVVQGNHRSESPLSIEKSIIESMNKACKYSPEEKKERIERYRSKRNLRNFNKKIKYECRKTLADSRPRIKGRFARNDEIEKTDPQNEWSQASVEEEEDENIENWLNFLDAYSANLIQ